MRTYLKLLYVTMHNQLTAPTILLIRSVFLVLMIFIFHQFWQVLKTTGNTAVNLNPNDFLWYLLIAVTLQFSRPEGLHKQIEDDVKTGNIAYLIIRPIHILGIYFCYSFGTFLARIPMLLLIGGSAVCLLEGQIPALSIVSASVIFGLMLISAIFASLCTVLIGLSVLYLYDSLPFFWIIQKCEYVLGGVFFPIIFYPKFFFTLCLMTPFGWSIYGVAHLIYDFSAAAAWDTFFHLLGWNVAALLCVNAVWALLKRRVYVYG